MAGLLAGLQRCRTEWLALLPVDCPYFPPEAFAAALLDAGSARVVGWLDHGRRAQWLPGLYHKDLIGSLETSLAHNRLSLGRWVTAQDHLFLPWILPEVPAHDAFLNLNTPEQALAAGFAWRT